ncbi:MAG: integrase, partial [Anaerolineae bacterium]|nr:integrase [Anaerolineae bacterium]
MATGKKMSVQDRRKFLLIQQERYLWASRSAKSAMLDAMEADTHLHRKHLIRLMNSDDIRPRKRNRERSRTYGPEVEHVVRLVADALDWPGAERVQPVLADMAQHLARFGHLALTEP